MYGSPLVPCMALGCVLRLDAWRVRSLLRLRGRPAYRRPCALFSLGGGFLDGRA